MKTKFSIFLILVVSVSLSVAQEPGKLVIRNASADYPKFIVSMNGIRINNSYSDVVNFDYLDDYNYRVKILQAGSTNFLSFNVNSAPKYVSKYLISKDNAGNFTLVLESKSLLSNQTDPAPTQPTATLLTPPVAQVMLQEDYDGIVSAIKKESFENSKLDLAQTFISAQNVSSEHVLGIMKLFSFENNKVAFAKYAYKRTLDKQNYYKVYEALSFANSKKEVSDFIKKNP